MASALSKDISQRKTMARLMAVQALYSMEVTGDWKNDLEMISNDDTGFFQQIAHGETEEGRLVEEADLRKVDRSYFRRVVVGAAKILEQADKQIEANLSKGWTLPRLGLLKQALLRAAIYELYAEPKAPAQVIISEYVNIASILLESGELKFINGILQSLAKTIREDNAA